MTPVSCARYRADAPGDEDAKQDAATMLTLANNRDCGDDDADMRALRRNAEVGEGARLIGATEREHRDKRTFIGRYDPGQSLSVRIYRDEQVNVGGDCVLEVCWGWRKRRWLPRTLEKRESEHRCPDKRRGGAPFAVSSPLPKAIRCVGEVGDAHARRRMR